MKVNPKISEEQNVLNHINQINEHPIKLSDITFGNPIVYVSLPETITKGQENDPRFMLKNTSIQVSAKPTSERWGGDAMVRKYRRIHLAAQWIKYDLEANTSDGRFIIMTNTWLHDNPTVEEVYSAISNQAEFKKESLVVEVLEYQQNRYNYDTGRLKVKPIDNSKIYIGSFELDVLYHPISFLSPTLDGFVGIEDSGYVDESVIENTLDGFVI